MSQSGRVVWHDCVTPDVDKSIDFYTKLFGWEIEEWQGEGMPEPYKMMKNAGETIGGFMQLDPETGAPPHWISYFMVDEIDAAMQRVLMAGGQVVMPATPIPTIGKFAIVRDPTGGVVCPYESEHDARPEYEKGPPHGHFIWEELHATDPKQAAQFYGEVFGLSVQEMDMGEMGLYRILNRGEFGEAGIMQKPAEQPGPSSWLSYVHVDDVDAYAAKATELGGKTVVEPMTVPNVGRMSVHADSVGGMFAVYTPNS
ncbi:MAG: VOC family protein [Planctomycetota bacterium]